MSAKVHDILGRETNQESQIGWGPHQEHMSDTFSGYVDPKLRQECIEFYDEQKTQALVSKREGRTTDTTTII